MKYYFLSGKNVLIRNIDNKKILQTKEDEKLKHDARLVNLPAYQNYVELLLSAYLQWKPLGLV